MDKDFEAEVTLHLKRIYKGININKKIEEEISKTFF